jgi:hypothetical protein
MVWIDVGILDLTEHILFNLNVITFLRSFTTIPCLLFGLTSSETIFASNLPGAVDPYPWIFSRNWQLHVVHLRLSQVSAYLNRLPRWIIITVTKPEWEKTTWLAKSHLT